MRLRFTGQQPVSFMNFPYLGEVEPGDFEARDADVEVLLLCTDIEAVEEPAPTALPTEAEAPTKPRKTATTKTPEAPAAGPSPTTA